MQKLPSPASGRGMICRTRRVFRHVRCASPSPTPSGHGFAPRGALPTRERTNTPLARLRGERSEGGEAGGGEGEISTLKPKQRLARRTPTICGTPEAAFCCFWATYHPAMCRTRTTNQAYLTEIWRLPLQKLPKSGAIRTTSRQGRLAPGANGRHSS
jgi:hypothetical protein